MRTDFEQEELVDDDASISGTLDSGSVRTLRTKTLPGQRLPHQVRPPSDDFAFNVWGRLVGNLVLATLIGIVPGAVAVGSALSLWVGSGMPALRAARLETATAEDEYHRALEASQPLLAELGSLGSPRDQLEVVYFAFEDASIVEQRHLADQYLGVLIDQVNLVAVSRGEASTRARKLLMPAIEARGRVSEAYLGWEELRHTPKGQIIDLLMFATPPSPGMELYRAPTVRKLLPPSDPSGL